MRRTAFLGLLAGAVALLAQVQGAALATTLTREHFHTRVRDTFTDGHFCGSLSVRYHATGVDNFTIYTRANGLPARILDSYQIKQTITNTVTHKTIYGHVAGHTSSLGHENPNGTTTFIDSINGVPEWWRSASGQTLTKDRGRIVFRTVFDFNDPANEDDDVFISQNVLSVSGPHPEAESGFTLFCKAVVPALT